MKKHLTYSLIFLTILSSLSPLTALEQPPLTPRTGAILALKAQLAQVQAQLTRVQEAQIGALTQIITLKDDNTKLRKDSEALIGIVVPLARSKQEQDALELEYEKKREEDSKLGPQFRRLVGMAGKSTQTMIAANTFAPYLKAFVQSVTPPAVAEAVSMVGAGMAGHYLVEGFNGACVKAFQFAIEQGKGKLHKDDKHFFNTGFFLIQVIQEEDDK